MNVNSASSVQSINRIFCILEILSDNPTGLSLAEICKASSLPKSTTSRLLASLISNGYAFQEIDNKRYRLTLRMFEVGSRAFGKTNILTIARPYLECLAKLSKETVHLVSRVDDEVIYLYKEEVNNAIVHMSSSVGMRNPMYCTGVGKSILAFLPDDEFFAIWNRTEHSKFTPHTITSLDAMQMERKHIHTLGYAIDNEEHELGVCCVAAPILDYNNMPIAAISIAAPVIRFSDQSIAKWTPALLEATSNISRYYGKSSAPFPIENHEVTNHP